MSVGPQNRKPAYSLELEAAILFTSPGMASWADPTLPRTCGDCAYREKIKRGRKGQGRCSKYEQLMGRHGALLGRQQQGCKFFDAAAGSGARPPEGPEERR